MGERPRVWAMTVCDLIWFDLVWILGRGVEEICG